MFMKLLGAAAALAMFAAVPADAQRHDRDGRGDRHHSYQSDRGHGYGNDRRHGYNNGRHRGWNKHRRGRYFHNGRYYQNRYRHHNGWAYR